MIQQAAWAKTDDCIIPSWFNGTRPIATVDGTRTLATRHVWAERHGDPGDHFVLHTCNGGSGDHGCINIRHLYLGTKSDNIRDAYASGHRQPTVLRGEASGTAKLTESDVLAIRRLHAAGWSYSRLAVLFGRAKPTIANVVTRTTWKHI